MVASINWDNLSYASAFLLGAALATVATLRVVRHVAHFFASLSERKDDPPTPPPSESE